MNIERAGRRLPLHTVPRRLLMGLVRGYRYFVSPALGSSCRFEPSCSAYALTALGAHGAAVGSCLSVYRLLRCGPWCQGGHDPVPEPGLVWPTRIFSRLVVSSSLDPRPVGCAPPAAPSPPASSSSPPRP